MKTLLLDPAQMLAVHRRRYPDGLVCQECGRLLATVGYGGRTYTCAECRSDAQEAAKVSAKRLAARQLEVGSPVMEAPQAPEAPERVDIAVLTKKPSRRVGTAKSPVFMRVPEVSKSNGRTRDHLAEAQAARQRRKAAKEAAHEKKRLDAQRQRDYQRAYRARQKAALKGGSRLTHG